MEGRSELACALGTGGLGLRCGLSFTVGLLNPIAGHHTLSRPHILHSAGLHASHAAHVAGPAAAAEAGSALASAAAASVSVNAALGVTTGGSAGAIMTHPGTGAGPLGGTAGGREWRREGVALLVRTLLASLVQPCPGTFLSQQGQTFTPVFLGW